MIALLVLLPALVLSAEYTIDWTKCGTETHCFCPTGGDPLNTFKPIVVSAPADIDQCKDIGMQNKFFTEEIALFQMQVKEDLNKLGDTPTLIVYEGPDPATPHFGCKLQSGKVKLIVGDPTWIDTFKMSLFEERSHFKEKDVLCSVKVERASTFGKKWQAAITTMILKTSQEKTFKHDTAQNLYFNKLATKLAIQCDPFGFKDLSAHKVDYVRPIINKDRKILNCEDYGLSYMMKYQKTVKGKDREYDLERLECKEMGEEYYLYELVKKKKDANGNVEKDTSGNDIIVKTNMFNSEDHTIFCVEKFSKVCEDPNEGNCPQSDPTCPVYKPGTKDENATITCDGKRWVLGDEYLELDSEPLCRRDSVKDQNAAAFFSSHLGNEKRIVKGARCFKQYKECKTSNIFLPVCNVSSTTCGVDMSDKMRLKCKDPTTHMQVQRKGENATTVMHLECNLDSGLWRDNSSKTVTVGSVVKCSANKTDFVKSVAKMTDSTVDTIAFGGAAGLCIFIGLVAFIVLFCVTRKHKNKIKEKKEWITMKKKEQLATCKDIFPQALLASPETSNIILDGLKMVDLLLESETDTLNIWDDAFKFLTRFYGTITRIDHSIWYMFSRYTFLQAKNIIDKHGWLSKKAINKKSPKGLIRCVAIRLLSYSLCDPFNEDAEAFLFAGFRKLGFRGLEQYPHCGVLWSVIIHTRTEYVRNKKTSSTTLLDDEAFANMMRDIGCKRKLPEQTQLSKEDVFPGIGSIAQQAAFAYGGSINQDYQTKKMRVNFKKKTNVIIGIDHWLNWYGNEEGGEVPLSFLEGAYQTLSHNPCGTVLDFCNMWPKPKPALLEKMKTVAPEKRWNAIIMDGIRHSTYFGRTMDAMRLRERFLPNEFDDEIAKLHIEQQQFEEAMEKVKEDLRAWFAAEIDKEELKKKPDYTIKSNVKLDNRVTAHGTESINKKGADACTPVHKSESESKSESKSNTSDNDPGAASPAPPAALAAAPDAAAAAVAPAAAAPAEAAAAPVAK